MSDIVHVIKTTIEEQTADQQAGLSSEEIKKKARYKISKKDYWDMVNKRNALGDQSVCKCGHDINHHEPSADIYMIPAGKCSVCFCKVYKDKEFL